MRAVAEAARLPLGSVHRLLHELEQAGAAERNDAGEWELSVRLFQITGAFLSRLELPQLMRTECQRIARHAGETVNLHLLRGRSIVCVDKQRGAEGAQLDWPIGSRAPLHCGGGGKAILAYLGAAEREAVIAEPLTAYTERTLTDRASLRAELAAIGARGYSIDDQEMVTGVYCVAVPIIDRLSRPVAAISISGGRPKAADAQTEPLVAMLQAAAQRASARLGYAGAWPPVPHDPWPDANGQQAFDT